MAVFCSSFISCFPVMLFRYFLNDEVVPVVSIISGITLFLHSIIIMFKNLKKRNNNNNIHIIKN